MKRVLLAEDNAHMRELIGDYLEENGFEVEAAADGLAAWEMFQTGNYQLILLDVMMPEMDGFTLCRNIREKENVPILFLTAQVQEEESYVLRNERAAGNVSEEKLVCRVSDIAIEDLEDPGQVEIGSLSMNLYAAQGDVVCTQPYYDPQTTYGLVTGTVEEETSCSDTECFWTRRVGSNPSIGGYCCSMNADVGQMIRDGRNLKRMVAPVWGCGQCFAAVLIILYLYIRKKKEKLAEMHNTFLNAIAHEMKTPAAVLKNTAECVREGIHPEKQEHYMEIIGQEADHMNELLNSMLIYTRVTDTFYHLQKEECFLETMAREVSRHYQDVLEKKQISLTGSAIRVYNEGEEIPAEEMERIWEPLYRADPSRAYEAGSSGMGLAISAAALKLHGADYGVKNVSGGVCAADV